MGIRELMGAALVGGMLVLGGCESNGTKADTMADLSEEEMMARWQAYMTPGPEHARLTERAGTWNATVTVWEDPSAPPAVSQATSVVEPVLGGRFMVDRFSGTMMGMPFEGRGMMGYDNHRDMYVSTWVDNFGTGLTVSEGHWNAAEGSFHMWGESSDPMGGGTSKMHIVDHPIDANSSIFTMYKVNDDGSEDKVMEIKYTRAS